jgi:hypothetical protein
LRSDALLHLDLLCKALLVVQLGPQAAKFLRIFRLSVELAGLAFSGAFLMVESSVASGSVSLLFVFFPFLVIPFVLVI